MNEVLGKLIEFLQSASPLVWQTLLKQVYLSAIGDVLFATGCAAVAFVCWLKASAYRKETTDVFTEDNWDNHFTLFVWLRSASIALLFVFSIAAYQGAMRFINPEYYAIQLILANIGGG